MGDNEVWGRRCRQLMAPMSFLPMDEERDWLVQSLRELIRAGGIAQFVAAPLLTVR